MVALPGIVLGDFSNWVVATAVFSLLVAIDGGWGDGWG